MAWVFLFTAGLCEMTAMYFLKLSGGFQKLKPSFLAILSFSLSFYLLSLSLKDLSIGTSYSIWTGIGAVGTVFLGIFIFKEKASRKKIFYVTLIIIGVAGLKMVS
ncbi:multidrug efflux SMR transporter [Halobacillus rhizosphaerae]|uniref:DMT family transporter n=1 Tax=Halobacillus rhizosphaerae TaxID=3064889 RepID=UPI00398B54D4